MNDSLDLPHLFDLMWNQSLKIIDRKAICASRGLDPKKVSAKEYFSPQGLSDAFSVFSDAERALLWLLAAQGRPVNLSFFNFYYSKDTRYLSEAKTRKHVQSRLKEQFVQKGVLATYEDDGRVDLSGKKSGANSGTPRYYFPDEFAAAMPLPFMPTTLPSEAEVEFNDSFLMNSVRTADLRPGPANDFGALLVLGNPYIPQAIQECQDTACQKLMGTGLPKWFDPFHGSWIALADAFLARLEPDQWVPANAFHLLECLPSAVKPLELTHVCTHLWTVAHLERARHKGVEHFRLAWPRRGRQPFTSYLSVYDADTFHVNLIQTPLAVLDSLERLFLFKKVDNGLLAKPDVSKISKADPSILESSLSKWLRGVLPAFDKILRDRSKKIGKFILHTNVLFAKIEDLSLKVALEKEFGSTGKWLSLDDRHAAFCTSISAEVESAVRKAKHVVKEVAP